MGKVYADIELINAVDFINARRNIIDKDEVKRMPVRILVDTGAYMLCINEQMQEILQLEAKGKQTFYLANHEPVEYEVAGPVDIRFKNRHTTCNALLLPGDSEPLLGQIPLEEMDVLIDNKRQELIVNPAHPDGAVLRI